MLSLACDYRVMTDGTKRNAWLCMNEVGFREYPPSPSYNYQISHHNRFTLVPSGLYLLPQFLGLSLVTTVCNARLL